MQCYVIFLTCCQDLIGFQHFSANYLMAFISLKVEEEGDSGQVLHTCHTHVKIHLTIPGFSVSVETLCHH